MKFCFVSIQNKFYNTLYCDFQNYPNHLVEVPSEIGRSKLVNALIGWKLPFPWIRAKIFYPLYSSGNSFGKAFANFRGESNVCYIIYGRVLQLYGPCIVTAIKKKNPNAKIVSYLGDVVSTFTFNIESIKKHFDLVLSCDRKDAQKHGMLFLQEPYSRINNDETTIEYDFMFVGSEKGRLDRIIDIYESLSFKGYKCIFYINGVRKNKQVYNDQIIYNTYLDYEDVVNLIRKSRCIIEVLQVDADTTTTRYSEALLYKKYLLTDSEYLSKTTDVPPNIICFDYKDWSVIDRIYQPLDYNVNHYIDVLSIETMTKHIEKYLNKD